MLGIDDIKLFLPKYLSSESEKELLENLENYSKKVQPNYFSPIFSTRSELLQGDAVDGLIIINLPDTRMENKKGILLSNTCDMYLDNKRIYPTSLTYAPLINFPAFIAGLNQNFPDKANEVKNLESDIRNQRITSTFFIPGSVSLPTDTFIFLDRICSVKNSQQLQNELISNKIFSLSNFGFYIFLFKISLHFSRIREGIDRS